MDERFGISQGLGYLPDQCLNTKHSLHSQMIVVRCLSRVQQMGEVSTNAMPLLRIKFKLSFQNGALAPSEPSRCSQQTPQLSICSLKDTPQRRILLCSHDRVVVFGHIGRRRGNPTPSRTHPAPTSQPDSPSSGDSVLWAG